MPGAACFGLKHAGFDLRRGELGARPILRSFRAAEQAKNVGDGRGIHRSTLLGAGRDRGRVDRNPKRRMAFGIRSVHLGVAGQEAFRNFRLPTRHYLVNERAMFAALRRKPVSVSA